MAKRRLISISLMSILIFLLSAVLMVGWMGQSFAGPLQQKHLAVIAASAVVSESNVVFGITNYPTGWTNVTNAFSVNSSPEYLYPATDWTTERSVYDTSLGGDDHWVIGKVRIGGASDRVGVQVRGSTSAQTYYYAYIQTTGCYLRYCLAGSCADIASDTGTTYLADTDYYIGLQVSGSSPPALIVKTGTTDPPANTVISTTDTGNNIPTGTRGGAYGYVTNATTTRVRIYSVYGKTGSLP